MTARRRHRSSRAAQAGRPAGATLILGAALLASPVNGAELQDCRAIADDRQRLACYDGIAGRPAPADSTPEALFGLEAAESTERLQRRLGEEPVESIEQPVAAITTDRFGKLRIRLATGQVWEQTDADRLRLQPGDTVTIRRAALGSYLLTRQDGGRAIRVRRVGAQPAAD